MEYPYTYTSHVYCGTPEGVPDQYYVKGNLDYVEYLVDSVRVRIIYACLPCNMCHSSIGLDHYNHSSLLQDQGPQFSLKGCNISMDRLYTSVEVYNSLLAKDITMIGTWNLNR